ncbi:PLS3 isoform 5 [Pan troglodytes]|uniref:Plastin 3 n=7 Tax=Hominoidea TaxID=314295 RepID=F2Z2Z9_HUMAN|nr:PLS3 isoform 1 [Pan troglodytes]PNJ54451.1 PLS3 isoform 4 [Pongo abelii]PNI40104.1 PLS3 isoform 2 [Pan troglodytes]PNI40107.1 PLS3 isoform 5 [Pan troglodytes]PNJ54455.1 PLS3 isoform 9 [Pongo abelii]
MDEMATTQISKDELDELKEAFAKVVETEFHRVSQDGLDLLTS